MIKKQIKFLSIPGLFILLTIILTWPLIIKIKTHLIGFHGTDEPFSALWTFWWQKYAWLNGLPRYVYSLKAAPFNISLYPVSAFPLWEFINKWLTILINNVAAYNIEALFSFVIAGLTMYYLVKNITNNVYSAILSGIIFTFCPYHFIRAWQHLGLSQIQWMPLYLLSLFVLVKRLNIISAFFAAICYYLIFSFDLYYAYFMFIVTVLFILFFLFFSDSGTKDKIRRVKSMLLMALLTLMLVSPSLFAIYKGIQCRAKGGVKAEYGDIRPFNDLFTQSSKALSYFLPAPDHPIFGKLTEQFVGTQIYGTSFTEHVLYVGWIPLILAFVAFRAWRKKRELKTSEKFYIGFFVFLAIAAWLFSQPPWWKFFGIKIYLPSFFMYKIAPMFRAYCRFGIVVLLGIAVLAGFGLKYLTGRFKSNRTKAVITAVACGMVIFEFWNWPPFKIIDVSRVPGAYYWLKTQPGDFTIAEYPLDLEGDDIDYLFCQTKHEKRMINGTIPGTYPNRVSKTIAKLSDPHTAGILKWMGVKYVLVHRSKYLQTELMEDREELEKISQNKNLRYIRTFPEQACPGQTMCTQATGQIDVYEVDAVPLKPEIKE
jgi:hypothetical protein